jgi:hypothetical protein
VTLCGAAGPLSCRLWAQIKRNDTGGNVLTRPAYVTQCYGFKGLGYLVSCADHTKDRVFPGLEGALGFAQEYNNKHHHGAVPYFRDWSNRQFELAGEKPLKDG